MERYFILAGNYQEAVRWTRKQHHYLRHHHWTWLSDPVFLRGIREPKIIKVGTWYLRDDLELFHSAFMQLNAVEAIESFHFSPCPSHIYGPNENN